MYKVVVDRLMSSSASTEIAPAAKEIIRNEI